MCKEGVKENERQCEKEEKKQKQEREQQERRRIGKAFAVSTVHPFPSIHSLHFDPGSAVLCTSLLREPGEDEEVFWTVQFVQG